MSRFDSFGVVVEMSSTEVVPGDRLLLETGNVIPADGRLSSVSNLEVDEAALTGESEPVAKHADLVFTSTRPLAERTNMTYSGTTVTRGRAEVIMTATGMQTERVVLQRLHEDLATRVEVDAEFTARVMGSLPRASWESSGKQGWGIAAAAAVVLALVSALVFSLAGPMASPRTI